MEEPDTAHFVGWVMKRHEDDVHRDPQEPRPAGRRLQGRSGHLELSALAKANEAIGGLSSPPELTRPLDGRGRAPAGTLLSEGAPDLVAYRDLTEEIAARIAAALRG
jgi:hypothetical protein